MKKRAKWLALAAASALGCMTLAACAPTNLDKAYKKMSAEGYKVDIIAENKDDDEGLLIARKSESLTERDVIVACLFENKEDAKEFYEEVKYNAGIFLAGLAIYGVDAEDVGSPTRDGKWVYFGSSDAIEDFTD